MTQNQTQTRRPFPILATLSVIIGVGTVVEMALAMIVGYEQSVRALPAVLLWCSVPLSMVGMALAVWSLVRRNVNRNVAHFGMWVNGLIFIFGVPVAIAWNVLM